jgi:hypothetical protein
MGRRAGRTLKSSAQDSSFDSCAIYSAQIRRWLPAVISPSRTDNNILLGFNRGLKIKFTAVSKKTPTYGAAGDSFSHGHFSSKS